MPWGDDWIQTSKMIAYMLQLKGNKCEEDDFIPYREGTSEERRLRRAKDNYDRIMAEDAEARRRMKQS